MAILAIFMNSYYQVNDRFLYPEMHHHPGGIDTQQRHAKCAIHTASEYPEEHAQSEEGHERHIQEEDGAVIQYPLPE